MRRSKSICQCLSQAPAFARWHHETMRRSAAATIPAPPWPSRPPLPQDSSRHSASATTAVPCPSRLRAPFLCIWCLPRQKEPVCKRMPEAAAGCPRSGSRRASTANRHRRGSSASHTAKKRPQSHIDQIPPRLAAMQLGMSLSGIFREKDQYFTLVGVE